MNTSLQTLSHLLVIGVIAAVLLTTFGGWLIVGNGLRPIARMTRTARAIAINAHAAGLGRRVGYRGPRDEVGELAATFDDMLGSIERVASAQRRFVADASHELRAPLTTIRGSLEFLRKARDLPPEEQAAVLEDAYTEAERMTALVNDLLLLARADAAAAGSDKGEQAARLDDQMRGRRELIEVDQLALDIFRHGRAQLAARNRSQLQLTIDGLEPVAVMADPGQLRQVMLILLDNAIKYTPAGKVRISVTRQGSRAAISISDTGIGIEPEIRQHIFERFFRGDQARDRDQHGSGLGLAIARWIIEAHNGEISVYSQPGKGTTFTILLPAIRRPGEHTSAKVPAVTATRTTRSVVAGAISPLARLAGSVSRPRTMPRAIKTLPRNKQLRDGKPAPRDGKGGQGQVGMKPARRRH
jgi:signal transduction histidine kinase